MFTHPAPAPASAYQLTRDSQPARTGRPAQPRRRTGPVRAVRRAATTAGAAAAAAALIMTPAGATSTPQPSAHVFGVHACCSHWGERWA